jgi:hypothetical protein
MYQDRTPEIEAAVVAANAHWHEAMVAHAEHKYRLRNDHSADSLRWASLARRLSWIPEATHATTFSSRARPATHDLADAVLATPAGRDQTLTEQGA